MIPCGEALAGVVMGFFGSLPVAGPVALVVVTKGLNRDYSGGRAVALGAGVAEGLLAGAVFAGMGLIVSGSPELAEALDLVGVLVLLGVGIWFALRGLDAPSGAEPGPDVESGRGALIGAGMVLGNPGMLGTWGGAVAALEGTGLIVARAQTAAMFGLGVAVGVVLWFWMLLAAIRRWSGVLNGRALDLAVRGIGVALIVMGAVAGLGVMGD